MSEIFNTLSSVNWALVLSAIGAIGTVAAWTINERLKLLADQYNRKEASYKEMLRTLRGFYAGEKDPSKLKREFLDQLNIAWLYCPDHVIKCGYTFLETVHEGKVSSDSEKEHALGEFVAAIRRDLLSRRLVQETKLSAADFRIIGST